MANFLTVKWTVHPTTTASTVDRVVVNGEDYTPTAGGAPNPPYASSGSPGARGNVGRVWIENRGTVDLWVTRQRYRDDGVAATLVDPNTDGSVDGSWRIPGGALDSWTVPNVASHEVRVTSGASTCAYSVGAET